MPSFTRLIATAALITLAGGALVVGGLVRPTSPAALAIPSQQNPTNAARPSLSVSGDGEARAEPDLAIVSMGATHLAPTAEAAMGEVNRRVSAIIDGVKA